MPVAYSYLRFSSPAQATSDTIRRQTHARERWLAAHPGVQLDQSLKMTDAGRSAFKRTDWDTYALARFVDYIRSGRVEPGSFLLLENLDRLSRENEGEATELFLSIVNKGVVVVQLMPEVVEFMRPVRMMDLMRAVLELSRGHSESLAKSQRCGAAWAQKQKDAGKKLVTRRLPAWVRYADGKLALDPAKAKVVRRIFRMAIDGQGATTIAKRLNAEGVPPLGRATMKGRPVGWANVTVRHIIKSRAAIGEYVPYATKRGRTPGEPVPGYYPAVVDERTFYAAQAATRVRGQVGRGRRGKHVNIFAGLLTDARDGGPLYYKHRSPYSAIVPINAMQGRSKWASFHAAVFDDAVLRQLREVKASDIVNDGGASAGVEVLSGRAEETRALIRAWEAKMDDVTIVDTVAAKLAELNARHKSISEQLAAAQREAASPLSEAIGGLRSLADLLETDSSDELRLKVRAAVRRAVSSVVCLFMPGRRVRLAAVQVFFSDTAASRFYVIWHKPRVGRGKQTSWGAWSGLPAAIPAEVAAGWREFEETVGKLTGKKVPPADPATPLDIRRPEDVRIVEAILAAYDQKTETFDSAKIMAAYTA